MSTTLDLLKAADDLIHSCEGLPPEEMEAAIHVWMDGASDKAAALQAVVSKADAQEEYLLSEARALTAAAAQHAAVAKRCRSLIVMLLRKQEAIGEPAVIRGAGWSMSLRLTKAVEVSDPAAIPASFLRVRTTSEPDKAAIKTAIESGDVVPGASIVTNYSATIRKAAK